MTNELLEKAKKQISAATGIYDTENIKITCADPNPYNQKTWFEAFYKGTRIFCGPLKII